MFNLEKLKDNNAIFWMYQFPKIRKAAADLGWAIGTHGSVTHDLDLMAMPWVENHCTADTLAQQIALAIDDLHRSVKKNDTEKPCNRVVYTIPAGASYIDLNVTKED